ncbi:MAG: response regulator [Eubacterium sp.]|nr:response regulator [Eubacterium sp.]
MDKNALFISRGAGFMAGTITSTLKKAGFDVISCEPEIKELNEKKDSSDLVIIYLGDYLAEAKDALIFLSDVVREDEKSLYLIGFKEELEAFLRVAPETKVVKVIERPFQANDLVVILEEYEEKVTSDAMKKKILIVDDDGLFLRSAAGWLSGKYHVAVVNSAMNAITYLATHTPDLILLDYEMPITDGPQFLKMIKSEISTESIPVIFLTTKGDKESVMTGISLKPEAYLLKSMSSAEILKTIEDFFEKRK